MIHAQTNDPSVVSPTEEVEEGALRLWETFLEALPRIGIAVTFILAGWAAARLIRWTLQRYWRRTHTESFARVMSKVVSTTVLGVVALAAVTVTFPSVKPVDLLASLGFFSIAIGFAFQDVLENALSGVLLLFRQPFEAGDQIEVDGKQGTVDAITIRETRLTTFDGQLVVMPNAQVFKNAVVVRTANPLRRDSFIVGVAYEADLEHARRLVVEAVSSVDGVDTSNRRPEALVSELGTSSVNIDVRFWTDPAQHNVLTVRSGAIVAAKRAVDDAGIELPTELVAIQATESLAAALRGDVDLTPAGAVRAPAESELRP